MVARAWRYAAGLALAVALGGVAGCTSGPAGSGSTTGISTNGVGGSAPTVATGPSVSTTSTGTGTGTGTATLAYPVDVPAEARVNSPAGAIAFARHFFAQVNKAYTTPQAGLIAPLSTSNCKSCDAFERTAQGFVLDGQRYDHIALEVLETSLNPDTTLPLSTSVDVVAHQFAAKVVNNSGATVRTVTERRGIFVVRLTRPAGIWVVDSIQVQQ